MTKSIYFPNFTQLLNQLKNLTIKEDTLIIADFDDTIFSRYEQLNGDSETSTLLRNNRGSKGNDIIKNVIGIDNMMDIYYKGKKYPKDIIGKMEIDKDLILTAGLPEIQNEKIKATGLSDFPLKVVLHAEDKPQEVIKYITEELKYIPSKIQIFEDRPQHFLATREILEKLTGAEVDIFLVTMKDNETKPEIKKV